MLSERVLDELVRRSALSEALCQALWPELVVESKLLQLAAYHADFSPSNQSLRRWRTSISCDLTPNATCSGESLGFLTGSRLTSQANDTRRGGRFLSAGRSLWSLAYLLKRLREIRARGACIRRVVRAQ